ncbi:IclR family transcriptional regulator [Streptomyces sp. NBC_00335]|uniref:IclR family transcriptional regulator n=1 Tax=unclassified Streptomyces TaxID=2593676 RepID=UPI00225972A0|nr:MULTISPECIES: IclR family transcriptional regulator [unclassified Streptomyces]MCX5406497.1 IclR family transcriptional regulator [Streptomyces sp. NBC_00086]
MPVQGAPQGVGRSSTTGSGSGSVGSTSAGSTSALEKTLRVTEALTAFGGPHRLAELSAAAGVPKSSTYRILVSLVEQGYAVTDGEGSYGLGLRLRTLAAEISTERPEGIGALLEFLQKCTGQSVHLALRSGNALTYIRTIESGRSCRASSRVGARIPLHATAIGKAVLAHLPPEEAEDILRATGMPALTRRTLTDREGLAAELRTVRERGYAVADEEYEPAVRCLGAPVFDRAGVPVGGVGLTAAALLGTRAELERFSPALLQAARGVQRLLQLGG